MNNRAITDVFSTLNNINYDNEAVAKNFAPIHAAFATSERDKRVSGTTQKRLQVNHSSIHSSLYKKKAQDSKADGQVSGYKLRKTIGHGDQKHKAPAVTDIMARHPSQKAIKHILEQSASMR